MEFLEVDAELYRQHSAPDKELVAIPAHRIVKLIAGKSQNHDGLEWDVTNIYLDTGEVICALQTISEIKARLASTTPTLPVDPPPAD